MIKIPKKALAMQGENGSVEPSVGDEVPLDGLKGIVKREDDMNVYVEPSEFNGMAIEADDSGDAEDATDTGDSTNGEEDPKGKKDLLELLQRDSEQGQ